LTSATCANDSYDLSADMLTCTGKASSITGVNCADTTRYVGNTTNATCDPRPSPISDISCPAGYNKVVDGNKCVAKLPGTISGLNCSPGYTANTTANKCEALDQNTRTLGCKSPWYDPAANLNENRCIASSYRSPIAYF
jgi:hypothetical protein